MTHTHTSINVLTSECDEWFDSHDEADKYIRTMEEGEYLQAYHVYIDGVWQSELSYIA